jgi:hypothetical protein
MTDDDKTMAKLEERSVNQGDRIEKLEGNQKWAVMALLSLVAKAAFDYMTGGR